MTVNVLRQLTTRLRFAFSPADRAQNRQYQEATNRTRRAVGSLAGANAALAASQHAVNSAMGGTIKALGGYAAVLGVAFGGSEVVQAADTLDELDNRLRAVVGQNAPLVTLRKELSRLSVLNFSNLDDTVQIFQRFKIGTEDVGASTEAILTFTDSVQKSAALSGATATETNAALIQFAQGIASNRFSGEELRSVSEQLPTLLRVLKRDLNLTTGELRELAFAGGLTSDVIFGAFERQRETILKEFERIQVTQQKAAQQLQTGLLTFFGRLGQGLGLNRTLAQFYGGMTEFLLAFEDAAFRLGRTLRGLFTLFFDFQNEVFSVLNPLFSNSFGAGRFFEQLAAFFQIFDTFRSGGKSFFEALRESLSFFFNPALAEGIMNLVRGIALLFQVLLVAKAFSVLKIALGTVLKVGLGLVRGVFSPLGALILGIQVAMTAFNRPNSQLRALWEKLVMLWNGGPNGEGLGAAFARLGNALLPLLTRAFNALVTVVEVVAGVLLKIIESLEAAFSIGKKIVTLGGNSGVGASAERVGNFLSGGEGTVSRRNGLGQVAALSAISPGVIAGLLRGGGGTSNQTNQVTLNVTPSQVGPVIDSLDRGGPLSNETARSLRVAGSGSN